MEEKYVNLDVMAVVAAVLKSVNWVYICQITFPIFPFVQS